MILYHYTSKAALECIREEGIKRPPIGLAIALTEDLDHHMSAQRWAAGTPEKLEVRICVEVPDNTLTSSDSTFSIYPWWYFKGEIIPADWFRSIMTVE